VPTRSIVALAALAFALALPAGALGQGAGDEEYSDPFGGSNQQQQPTPQPTPVPTQAPATAAPSQATPVPTTHVARAPSSARALPYTGAAAGLVALGGTVLLAAGVALRLRLREDD
jgi:hypothetical protein